MEIEIEKERKGFSVPSFVYIKCKFYKVRSCIKEKGIVVGIDTHILDNGFIQIVC